MAKANIVIQPGVDIESAVAVHAFVEMVFREGAGKYQETIRTALALFPHKSPDYTTITGCYFTNNVQDDAPESIIAGA